MKKEFEEDRKQRGRKQSQKCLEERVATVPLFIACGHLYSKRPPRNLAYPMALLQSCKFLFVRDTTLLAVWVSSFTLMDFSFLRPIAERGKDFRIRQHVEHFLCISAIKSNRFQFQHLQ